MALGHRRLRRIPSVFAIMAPLSGYVTKPSDSLVFDAATERLIPDTKVRAVA